MQRLARLIKAEGFNIGLNLGRVAGAGVPGHHHGHLVPRWTGDNNFMPVIADTRIISQSLEALWEAITQAADTSP
jgi:ATP adenylyltransferase